MSQPGDTYSGSRLRTLLFEAYQVGFAESAEGYNGEYPVDAEPDIGAFEDWLADHGLLELDKGDSHAG